MDQYRRWAGTEPYLAPSNNYNMRKPRISDEWLIGATLGVYLILTVVGNSWEYAFIHPWCIATFSPPPPPSAMEFVELPLLGFLIAIAGWLQSKCSQVPGAMLNRRHARIALWLNLLGILGSLVALGSNYGPGERDLFLALIAIAGLVLWPVGILLSLGNLVWASIRWIRAPHATPPGSEYRP